MFHRFVSRVFSSIFTLAWGAALLMGGALPSWAGNVGMVTSCSAEGDITVNRGAQDSVMPGTRWFIYRNRKPLAELEVVLVDTYSSTARVVSGGSVRVGDAVTDDSFSKAPADSEYATEDQKLAAQAAVQAQPDKAPSITDIPKNQIKNNPGVPEKPEDLDSVTRSYEKTLEGHCCTRDFKGGSGKKDKFNVNPLQVVNMFTAMSGRSIGSMHWQNAASVIPGEVMTNIDTYRLYQDSVLKVKVTFWDENLCNAYADYMSFKEGRTDMSDRLNMRAGLAAQKGLDKYLVFHVQMENEGPGTVQVEPFHYHIYLADAQGNRVKAERYDQILDRALNKGTATEGYVYFLKVDAAGKPISNGKKMVVVLEDILGERAELKF